MEIDDRITTSPTPETSVARSPFSSSRLAVIGPCLLVGVFLELIFMVGSTAGWPWQQRIEVFAWALAGPIPLLNLLGYGLTVGTGAVMIACILPPATVAYFIKPNRVAGVAIVVGSFFWFAIGMLHIWVSLYAG